MVWKSDLWSDQTLLGEERKGRGGNVMWGHSAASGTGNLVHVHGIMKQGAECIWKDNLKKSATSLALNHPQVFKAT